MAFRRILFEPLSVCNTSCRVAPPPSVGIASIRFADHNHDRFNIRTTVISIIISVFVVSIAVYLFYRRRQRPGRHLPHATAASFPPSDHGEEIHPAWHIRTVGLDETMIRSVAVAEYKAGDGLLGSTYCSVCLKFQDGELVRLLPKCSHSFHVRCIDTWLRAHVNCPLCRADIFDPAADPTGAAPPPSSATPPAILVEGSSSLAPPDNPNVGIQAPDF